MTTPTPSPVGGRTRRPLGAGYWKLWSSSAVSNFGDGLSIIAYPWLASALTRNPVAIAGVALASRLPWLLFTLPAGVITDRHDRRRLVVSMDLARFVLTFGVALVVLVGEDSLPDPTALADGVASAPDNAGVALALLYVASVLLGTAEVLRDNAAQTIMPSIVDADQLERANGRLWGVEMVMNSFVGPPAAGLLLAVSLALPFVIDAGTFAVAAALLFSIAGDFRPKGRAVAEAGTRPSFRGELTEGFRWLWQHRFLRSLAISLGVLNGLGAATIAAHVLFAQEVLGLSAAGFGLLGTSFAIGGVAGSLAAEQVTQKLGPGGSLFATILGSAVTALLTGAIPSVGLVFAAFVVGTFIGAVWNVITVSLRQQLIPDHLLGRVNSVYRFFGWGMMPLGTLLGGVLIAVAETTMSREMALRLPYLVAAGGYMLLLVYALPRLNTAEIDRARAGAGMAPTGQPSMPSGMG